MYRQARPGVRIDMWNPSKFYQDKEFLLSRYLRASPYWLESNTIIVPTVTSLTYHLFWLQLKMPANQATLGRLEAVLARLEVVAAKLGVEGSFKKGSSQSSSDIKALVARLEAVADKLDQQSASGGEGNCVFCLRRFP